VVFAKRPLGTAKGRLVWREPLVWAAAETFDLVLGAALPLALYRERSVSREAALAALQGGELKWEIVYTSANLTGLRAAIFTFFCSPHDRRAQNSGCGYAAESFYIGAPGDRQGVGGASPLR
jgi:hypothetical protein